MSQDFNNQQLPKEYKPLGAWGYYGYSILFKIPVVGIIVLAILALGGGSNINLRSFARSYFCAFIVRILLLCVVLVLLVATGGMQALVDNIDNIVNINGLTF